MCGIYGTTIAYTEEQVLQKLKRTSFRGPDQMGCQTYRNSGITFGHNRLAIIDLDARSNQPFSYSEEIHIVFNGEIFNFKELRKELKSKGYSFRTTSDTEVICAAYLEYGESCVSHFNGMFAFVIYDVRQNKLYGAKDRVGQKPFYYYLNGSKFEFASQISSIQLFNKDLSISKTAIHEYLSWKSVPSTISIYNEIKKLEDGHWFSYDLKSYEFKTKQYWDIPYNSEQLYRGTYPEAQEELEALLENAVDIRMFADVPVGVFLSGGVDSALISAMATKNNSKKVKTFSVKFNEKGFDESVYAKRVADHLNTEHYVIECDYNDGLSLIENFSTYYDEPFSDSSAIPSMLLAKNTKEHVTVALSGDGGDESFLGYRRYEWIDNNKKIIGLPKFLRKTAAKSLTSLSNGTRAEVLSELLQSENIESAYLKSVTKYGSPWMTNKNACSFKELKYLMHNKKNILERISDFDIKTYLNWDINTKVDRASMAYSLEVRSPFLDYRIIEMARHLPTSFKFIKGNQKRILKDILYKHIPKEIFDRPKAGFSMPLGVWFRKDLKDYVLTELSEKNLKEIPGINTDVVLQMINDHMTGAWDHNYFIWKLLVLRQWLNINGQGLSIR
ncbi:asparagine synthase (glutamine-hydrolyzing) [Zobellia roscoffensis]|uniref:asparagine synthase (glutamine-hydrolyzing) n=1 Tax=Zobellia roscoffensis TaxID=2779508 RepID=UPI00188BC35F|nr:asparagine synthase (glutamine-hydrolyzing) [Zobellia roscoffensis]